MGRGVGGSCRALALVLVSLCLATGALALHRATEAPLGADVTRRSVQSGCVLLAGGAPPRFAAGAESAACAGAAARGHLQPASHASGGWHQLSISTSPGFPDGQQAAALGWLEGWLTAELIFAHWHNMRTHFNLSTTAVLDWLEAQDRWTRQQAAAPEHADDAFWAAMRLLHAQMDGMRAGYAARAAAEGDGALPPLTRADFLFLSSVGDLDPLVERLEGSDAAWERKWQRLSPTELMAEMHATGRCSALVRVLPDFSDLLLAHSAWFTYGSLVRVYKHYRLALADPRLPLRRMSFSSYPGELSSDDDWYLLGTGLAVLQTTNQVLDRSLLRLLSPQSVPSWARARVACHTATDAEGWAAAVQRYNSGTGTNQYMAVDLKRFTPGRELPRGLLWVVETMPGMEVASDQTGTLERGSWPSYNIPYYPEIYHWAGYPAFLQQQAERGPAYRDAAVAGASYQLAPRASIFRRDTSSVQGLGSLKALLRSNAWPHEPLSGGSPLGALCGRGDLDPARPRAAGCYDTKVASWAQALRLEADAVVGPTHAGGHAPFAWSSAGPLAERVAHIGQPDRFDFSFRRMTPNVSLWER